jgi:hypothetical protein
MELIVSGGKSEAVSGTFFLWEPYGFELQCRCWAISKLAPLFVLEQIGWGNIIGEQCEIEGGRE